MSFDKEKLAFQRCRKHGTPLPYEGREGGGEGLKIWWGALGDIERPRKGIVKKLLVNVGLKIDKNSD